jgi:tRNA/tmRNA/rRNA uracil-C5-methylase (TrmA/RlmC/RlmD family)
LNLRIFAIRRENENSQLFHCFQVNTPAAEVLYATIGELAAPTEKTTVLDICCGTGTIGISMAKVQTPEFLSPKY